MLTLLIVLVAGCVAQPSPSGSVASATQQASASQFATEGSSASQAASPTASPEPALSLELPKRQEGSSYVRPPRETMRYVPEIY